MKVLILGASGFIGGPVSQAFVRSGHEVYGSTRSQEKAPGLAAKEIMPLVGEEWKSIAADMDVIVDCTAAYGPDMAVPNLKTVAEISKKRDSLYKISYIFTSGTWVHGNMDQRGGFFADERSPTKKSPDLVEWRALFERDVLQNPDVNGIVIRPALLYGKSMSLLEPLFQQAMAGKIEWVGAPGDRYSLIHGDDLADLYVRVGEGASMYKGLTFDAANPQSESLDDLLAKLAQVSGCSGYSYRAPQNTFEVAMTTTSFTRPSLGRALTGWVPKKFGLVDGMQVYYKTYVASQKK
ncbi:NADP-binding protein [Dacryopinax primogenitus]|uniref:NADP-binding protein n=1 Tax=Dacryopinax primogenitus (strain DJM 731) TaxID=1858805 RepID=M5GD90_DACPD|nr:NADP-binding protein [Dacryopinax primogenitus]EJU04357.1 NADP-binding protein [Dacryopinax primogenitus]